ncbi:hypothetical protein TREMEDRAFT_70084 [Tremella mesenterica DSM 1558]|uniref:uncharacterized protein n=1 Tax=Tremella mesenterica (strain ATCC 24925 / CBS 8224 / DSM 1558 / NBRC 9311 / NRRL Y-6157 / RJB 2259-6 / UBC 559-6) TaxID=578456 RepID=UPI00032C6376|nr:uncharacterized protein TREMEDRAFT_70084 [Tremella mesenterica DSM 1558]EIW66481.1 hypothetical protein TREMEDRAFT_70084 [Tremella mesenterica DSM 1558]
MGKTQYKKKTQAWRHNPIRVPDSHLGSGKAAGKVDPTKEKQMLPVLQKLKSPSHADRTWACAAICNLIQDDPATRRLFQSRNVVGELIERLSDSVDEVVVEASGALRNLAIDGGHELCGEMFNKGIISHLGVLSGKVSSTVEQFIVEADTQISTTIQAISTPVQGRLTDDQLQARKHLLQLTENVITLIWSLAETSHKTLQGVMGMGVEGLLIQILDRREMLGPGVVVAAAQALYSLSSDNEPFKLALLRHPMALSTIVDICQVDHTRDSHQTSNRKPNGKGKEKSNGMMDDEDELGDGRTLLARLLLCGVLRNVVTTGSEADQSINLIALTTKTIVPLIDGLIDINLPSVVDRVISLVSQLPSQDLTEALDHQLNGHRSAPSLTLERIERRLHTVSVALEILTGICAGLEELEESEQPDEPDGEDEEMDSDSLPDEDIIAQSQDHSNMSTQPTPVVISTSITLSHLITTLSLPQRLTTLAQLTPLSFPPASDQPSPHPPTTSALSILHLRALEALNNLLLTIAAASETDPTVKGPVPSQGVWEGMMTVIALLYAEADALKRKGHEMRREVLEMALGCLWGAVKVSEEGLLVRPDQIQGLLTLLPLIREPAQTRLIETLSLLASRPNVSLEENQTPEGSILVSLLNAIIDIYADETRSYDGPVFVAGGYLEALTGVVGRVRSAVKKIDRRTDRLLRAQAEEAQENLTAYIKYRRAL